MAWRVLPAPFVFFPFSSLARLSADYYLALALEQFHVFTPSVSSKLFEEDVELRRNLAQRLASGVLSERFPVALTPCIRLPQFFTCMLGTVAMVFGEGVRAMSDIVW